MRCLAQSFIGPRVSSDQGRRRCDEAGLKHCSAHGLRKAGATIAADNGATARELMAIFGWETLRQAEVDTRQADRKRLADRAMYLVVPRDEEREDNQSVPLSGGEGSRTNKGA
jgi:integrase